MYELISNNSRYIVPLDSVDLSYLTRQFHDGSKMPMPLWRIPKCEEYYEFKINAWRTADSDDGEEDADFISSECQLCHICNIHVPVIYIKEHNNSEIHRNMKKILNLMVIRGRNADLSPTENPQTQNYYYCEDCSIVIAEDSKKKHESTYTHKKSQRNKSLIEQFLKFYSEDYTENTNNKILPLQDYFNKYVNRKNLSFKINVINEDSLRIIAQERMFTINCDNFHGFMKTDAELICILCEMSVGRVAKLIEQHIGSKKHRKKITLLIDDKHCIREFNDSFAHCIPCNELVLLYRIEGHKRTSHHIANLNLAKGRKDCRDINKNYISPEDISDYRLGNSFRKYLKDELADKEANSEENEAVQDISDIDGAKNNVSHNTNIVSKNNPTYKGIDFHIDKKLIQTLVEQLLSSKNNVDKEKMESVKDFNYIHKTSAETDVQINDNVANLNPTSCEEIIDINKPNINLSEEDKVSDNDVISDPEPIDIPEDFLEQVDYLIFETIREKEIICKVCNILMLNTDSKLYIHFNGDNHTTEYNDLLKSNRVTKAQNKFFCYSCKVSITSKNELEHIFGNRHRNKFANNTDVRIYCELCKVYISDDSVEEHQNTKQHSQGYKLNEKNVPTQIVEEEAESSDSTSDLQNYDDNIDLFDRDVIPIELGKKTVNIPAVFLKLHYHFEKTLNPAEVLCKICNLVVPNTGVTIDTHVEGFYHSNKYDNLLKYNRIKNDGSRFHCQICDVFVTFNNEIEHIAGTKHKSKIADEQNNDVQSSDEASDAETVPTSLDNKDDESNKEMIQTTKQIQEHIEIKGDNVDDEIMQGGEITKDGDTVQTISEEVIKVTHAAIIQPDYWKIHYHMSKTSNTNDVLCKICNVTLSRSVVNVNSHVQGNNHSNQYRVFLQSNQIECHGFRFHCKICDVFVSPKNEIEHIEGNKHKNRMTEEMSTNNTDDHNCDDADDQQIDYTGDDISEYTDDQISDEMDDQISGEMDEQISNTHKNMMTEEMGTDNTDDHNYDDTDDQQTDYTCDEISEYTDDQISDEMDDQISNKEITPAPHYTAVAPPAKETIERSNQIPRGAESIQATNTRAVKVKQTANIQPDYQKMHYHTSITDNSEVLCKVCNVILTNSIANVNSHVQGYNHSRKYIALLQSNKVENNGPNLVCNICNVLIPLRNEIEHISGGKHKSKVAAQISSHKTNDESSNELSDDETSSDAVLVETSDQIPKNVEANNNDDGSIQEAKVDLLKPHYHVTKTANNSEVLCKICNVVLSNSEVNINTHVKGYNHSYNYNLLLENNRVEKDDNIFRCHTCNVAVSNKNEIDHIFGLRHKTNKTKMQNAVNNTNNDESDPTQRLMQALNRLNELINLYNH